MKVICPFTKDECKIRVPQACFVACDTQDNWNKCPRVEELELFIRSGLYAQKHRLYKDARFSIEAFLESEL